MTDDQREFHLKEYDGVRAEVSMLLLRIENLFKYSVVASATVFAWLLTNSMGSTDTGALCLKATQEILTFAWLIPAVFIYLAFALAGVNYLRVLLMGRYLAKLETKLGAKELGWERANTKGFPSLTFATALVWVVMMYGAYQGAEMGKSMVQKGQTAGICKAPK